MFEEFRTQNRTHAYLTTALFPILVYVHALFMHLIFFLKALLDASVSSQRYTFKKN